MLKFPINLVLVIHLIMYTSGTDTCTALTETFILDYYVIMYTSGTDTCTALTETFILD
jgi:hypothetical protein